MNKKISPFHVGATQFGGGGDVMCIIVFRVLCSLKSLISRFAYIILLPLIKLCCEYCNFQSEVPVSEKLRILMKCRLFNCNSDIIFPFCSQHDYIILKEKCAKLLCNFNVSNVAWKRPLGRPKRRWVDNIKMDLLEIVWSGVDWIGLAQKRDKWRTLVNAVMNLRVP
jgi:hypothetical protein